MLARGRVPSSAQQSLRVSSINAGLSSNDPRLGNRLGILAGALGQLAQVRHPRRSASTVDCRLNACSSSRASVRALRAREQRLEPGHSLSDIASTAARPSSSCATVASASARLSACSSSTA
jgi:hypothetical protein